MLSNASIGQHWRSKLIGFGNYMVRLVVQTNNKNHPIFYLSRSIIRDPKKNKG
jgi:hypothetical protein